MSVRTFTFIQIIDQRNAESVIRIVPPVPEEQILALTAVPATDIAAGAARAGS
jgi:hypothetical protein